MAGKISLAIIVIVATFGFGYQVRVLKELESRERMLQFRVAQVVLEGSEQETITGMRPPYTVLVHSGPYVQQALPGQLGNLGDEIYLPDPRYSSESTSSP